MSSRYGLLIGVLTAVGSTVLYALGRRTMSSSLGATRDYDWDILNLPLRERYDEFRRIAAANKAKVELERIADKKRRHYIQSIQRKVNEDIEESAKAYKLRVEHSTSDMPPAWDQSWQRLRDDDESRSSEILRSDCWLPLPSLEEQEVDEYDFPDIEDEEELPFGGSCASH
jgi:hypothetical protein